MKSDLENQNEIAGLHGYLKGLVNVLKEHSLHPVMNRENIIWLADEICASEEKLFKMYEIYKIWHS